MDNELRLRNEHAKQLMQEDACARRNYQLENKINTLATKQRERDQLLERRKQVGSECATSLLSAAIGCRINRSSTISTYIGAGKL